MFYLKNGEIDYSGLRNLDSIFRVLPEAQPVTLRAPSIKDFCIYS